MLDGITKALNLWNVDFIHNKAKAYGKGKTYNQIFQRNLKRDQGSEITSTQLNILRGKDDIDDKIVTILSKNEAIESTGKSLLSEEQIDDSESHINPKIIDTSIKPQERLGGSPTTTEDHTSQTLTS